ncbi:MAG: hypothetical protein ACK4MG_01495 [Aquabacterium sp.]
MQIGVDPALVASGVPSRWAQALTRDLGWAPRWHAEPALRLLDRLAQGQLDAAVFLSHPAADALDQQGLIHSRMPLARTAVYLVGPQADLAGLRQRDDLAEALAHAVLAHEAGAARWTPPAPGSALEALAARLLQGHVVSRLGSAAIPPRPRSEGIDRQPAYMLTTRAEWEAGDGARAGLRVWVAGGEESTLQAEFALPMRRRHPAARLLSQWLQGSMAESAWRQGRPGWVPLR